MSHTSPAMQQYFDQLNEHIQEAHKLATKARSQGFDPEERVTTVLTKTMAERVEGLVSLAAPQIRNSGVSKVIEILEKKHGVLSLQVALDIAAQVAQEKFCSFPDKKTAIEAGIRTGFAYHTVGVVAAPLDGFVGIDIKKRRDGGEYLSPKFSGPIRGAGGTAITVCLLIIDHIRQLFDYQQYDPDEKELKRYATELEDYHDHVTNLQYKPASEEIEFLMSHCPLEISGDPTEKREVSNYKDLPRIATNRIRGGVALVVSMLALKAPKLSRLIKSLDAPLNTWNFLEEFLSIQKQKKSQGDTAKQTQLLPDYTFLADLVAGRPVFSFPLRSGGFRLRYGRTRLSGFSATAIHPATMHIMKGYLATGTQLKTERPGKATALTPCETIEGPTVLLEDGTVLTLQTDQEALTHEKQIKEILYLGDILVSYGDFLDRAHPLVPAGYCEEWHMLEVEKQAAQLFGDSTLSTLSQQLGVSEKEMEAYFSSGATPPWELVQKACIMLKVPVHPHYTYHWKAISAEQLTVLYNWLGEHYKAEEAKFVLPFTAEAKRALELLAVPHTLSQNEFVVIDKHHSAALVACLTLDKYQHKIFSGEQVLLLVRDLSRFFLQDKHGTSIGCRMGRPEKAKMRKMIGSPHILFPVGSEGGKLRSFQAALGKGRIVADFPRYLTSEGKESIYATEPHGEKNTPLFTAGNQVFKAAKKPADALSYSRRAIPINEYYQQALDTLGIKHAPDLIKGVRGTSNDEHILEYLPKGILRAHHEVFVNKDGTIRYDMSELPITHFTPAEVEVPVQKLRELGYTKDYQGNSLEHADQILELKPQDLILPASSGLFQEGADKSLLRVSKFIDDLLKKLYKLPSFYHCKTHQDLVGLLVAGLAPHTSAAIVGRIIGFSKTQCFFAHPLFHAAMRRDADGDEACVVLLMDLFLNFSYQYLPSSRGARTMDAAIVLTSTLVPSEVDDMVHKLDIASQYPLALYEAALNMKNPWDVEVEQLGSRLNTAAQYEGLSFTHHVTDMNAGILHSAYKTLPSMEDKLKGQMELAEKIRAVDETEVAKMVVEKHFIKDIKGNLRRFGNQQFRCVDCNEKFRRPPLRGNCLKCKGKLLFTVAEGSIVKYLEPALSLMEHYSEENSYTHQSLLLVKNRIEEVFGKPKEGQHGLGKWFQPK